MVRLSPADVPATETDLRAEIGRDVLKMVLPPLALVNDKLPELAMIVVDSGVGVVMVPLMFRFRELAATF